MTEVAILPSTFCGCDWILISNLHSGQKAIHAARKGPNRTVRQQTVNSSAPRQSKIWISDWKVVPTSSVYELLRLNVGTTWSDAKKKTCFGLFIFVFRTLKQHINVCLLLYSYELFFPFLFRMTPGACFIKEVQQNLSLTLNSELIYFQFWNSEFLVPEKLVWVSSLHSELHVCTTTIKKVTLMVPRYYDSPWQQWTKSIPPTFYLWN